MFIDIPGFSWSSRRSNSINNTIKRTLTLQLVFQFKDFIHFFLQQLHQGLSTILLAGDTIEDFGNNYPLEFLARESFKFSNAVEIRRAYNKFLNPGVWKSRCTLKASRIALRLLGNRMPKSVFITHAMDIYEKCSTFIHTYRQFLKGQTSSINVHELLGMVPDFSDEEKESVQIINSILE